MKKLSKIAALVLTMSLCLSFTAPAFAAETQAANDLQSRIYDAEHGITQVAYDAETMPNFDAYIEDENSVRTPVETSYTVRKVVSLETFSRSTVPAPEVYELTAVTRTEDKSYTDTTSDSNYSVAASVTVTFIPGNNWNASIKSTLKKVVGNWTVNDSRTNLSKQNVAWLSESTDAVNKYPTSNSFTYENINFTPKKYNFFRVETNVTMKQGSETTGEKLHLSTKSITE